MTEDISENTGERSMQRICREQAYNYLFDSRQKPALEVLPGESFVVETEDAFSGKIHSVADVVEYPRLPSSKKTPPLGNPVAGPISVQGAQRGDVLAVHIERIVVDEIGHTKWTSLRDPLFNDPRWSSLNAPALQAIRHVKGPSGTTRDGRAIAGDRLSWELRPFIGTIGVAPECEVTTSTIGQGPWGGNMDCRDFKEGTTAYFQVYHDGGLLYLGDVHGSQGDGEFYGSADETRAEVTLRCEVIKSKQIPFVRLAKPDSIVSLFCYRPLEQAVESAIANLMAWMTEDYGVEARDAYIHITVNPDFRVNVYQMVRWDYIQYTVGAEIPTKYLAATQRGPEARKVRSGA
jgi:acetamidase/formamidase